MKVYIVEAMMEDKNIVRGYSGKMFYSGEDENEANRIKEELEKDEKYKNITLLEFEVEQPND